MTRHLGGRIAPLDRGPALLGIEAAIAKAQLARVDLGLEQHAAPLAAHAAHFEDVSEVGLEHEAERDGNGRVTVVSQADGLVPRVLPQEP